MMRRIHQVVITIWIGLLTAWVFHFPFNEPVLWSAIPPDARFVSRHDALSDRLDLVAHNPVAPAMLGFAGYAPNEAAEILRHPMLGLLVRIIGRRETLLAYADSIAPNDLEGWVLAGWGGGRAQWLRLAFWLRQVPGFRSVPVGGGRQVWTCPMGDGWYLSVSVLDGMVLAVYSRDALAVRWIVRRVNARQGSVLPDQLQAPGESCGVMDRGILKYGWNSPRLRVRDPYVQVDSLTTNRLALTLRASTESPRMPGGLPLPAAPLGQVVDVAWWRKLWGNTPQMVAVMPASLLPELLDAGGVADVVPKEWLTGDGHVMAGIFGGVYGGRLLGFNIPSLIVGWPVKDEADIIRRLPQVVDRLNARYRKGLVLVRREMRGRSWQVLASTQDDWYGSLETRAGFGVAVWDGWLILSTHSGTLERLLARDVSGDPATPHWEHALIQAPAGACCWMNLPAAETTLRQGVALAALMRMVNTGGAMHHVSADLESWRRLLDGLMPLEQAVIRLSSDKDTLTARIQAGFP